MGRMNHNTDMSVPHDQIGRLWLQNALKSLDASIKIFGIRIFVRKAGTLIDGMHEMRAIVSILPHCLGMKRHCNHRRAVLFGERSWERVLRADRSGLRRLPRHLGLRSLGRGSTQYHQTSHSNARGFQNFPHVYIVMPFRAKPQVTFVKAPREIGRAGHAIVQVSDDMMKIT